MNSYDLSRNWFNFCFDNPELISPSHTAIYFFAIEHCNRLGWKVKFGFPTMMVCDAIGIKKASTYIKYLNDLVEWGFIKMIQKSSNQYSANIISLVVADPKKGEALDKAIVKHRDKQGISTSPIDKPIEPITIKQDNGSIFINYSDFKLSESETEQISKVHSLNSLDKPLEDFKYLNDEVKSRSEIMKHFKNWMKHNGDSYKERKRSIL